VGVVASVLWGFSAQAADITKQATRVNIDGIDVVLYPTQAKDMVTIAGSLPAGYFSGEQEVAVAALAGAMLDKGTQSQDKFAISRRLDQVGARLRFNVSGQGLNIDGRSLKADLPLVLKILAEELRQPAFSPEEFAKAKIQLAGSMKRKAESTEYRADEAFRLAAYPAGHANRPVPLSDWQPSIDKATLDAVKNFHHKFYGPSHMVLVLVGDLDVPKIRGELEKDFAGWAGGAAALGSLKASSGTAANQVLAMPGKTSVTVIVGQATGLRYADPDALPLRLGVSVLGSGFSGRLMNAVRDKEGLTYHIHAALENDTFNDGDWYINASFAPSLLDKGVASTERELRKWAKEGITAQELEDRKSALIGSFQVSLADTVGMADALLHTVQRGQALSAMDDYPKQINALTLDQVNAAIKRYVDPSKLIVIKAGSVGP